MHERSADDGAPTVGEAGELETLRRLLSILPPPPDEVLGAGDDAAVVPAPDGRFVVTTDLMVEVPDFRRNWSRPEEIGAKAVVSNASDVAAMGARPTSFVVGLGMPGRTPLAWVEGFARGVRDAIAELVPGAHVVGGDLSSGERLFVSVTAFGDLDGGEPVRRSGAAPGEVLALAGVAGRSATGLALLLHADADPDGEPPLGSVPDRLRALGPAVAAVVDQHLAPLAPVLAGVAARTAGATAMLDVSDGLTLDAARLARASGVTVDLDPAALVDDVAASREALLLGTRARDDAGPDAAEPAAVDPDSADPAPADLAPADLDAWALDLVLAGGEDHALLATFPAGSTLPEPFRAIGRVTATVDEHRTPAERAAGFVGGRDTARVTVAGVSREIAGWDPYAPPAER